jgi:hypothetical protein
VSIKTEKWLTLRQLYFLSKLKEEHPDAKMGKAKMAVATDHSLLVEC